MALLPKLTLSGGSAEKTEVFGGYDRNERISEGAWYDEENMTAELHPVLATRRQRREVRTLTAPAGMITKDALAVIDGTKVLYNDYEIEMELSTAAADCPKQLVSMGAYLLIWPDRKYLNTQNISDYGSIDQAVTVTTGVTVTLCTAEGTAYTAAEGAAAPDNPTDGAVWLDTSEPTVPVLKEWSASSAMWVTIPTVYAKLSGSGIGAGFDLYDGVEISGLTGTAAALNGNAALWGVHHDEQTPGNDYVIVIGILTDATVTVADAVTVARRAPEMDFVVECGNRLWGCKYGMVDGKAVNEIYASKLGDFKNWRCYMGLATDSYAASRGADGVFTGAAAHLGHPLFFREGCIEKVYPGSNGAHQIVTTQARGVQKGCWRSLAIVGETLYYKSRAGVCAYTGSLPGVVSDALGEMAYSDARAGACGSLYYVSMRDEAGAWSLFTYDTEKRIWHREDGIKALCFAAMDGEMFYIDEEAATLTGCRGTSTGEIEWQVTSGVIGYAEAGNKYVSRFVIRAETEGKIHLELQYDGGPWLGKGSYFGTGELRSFVLPVPPRRCDHLRYRLSGDAACRIYSVAKYTAKGSDVMRH